MSFTSRIASAAARGYGMFAAVARAVDPFFNYVTALLHGDGTNGAQNNTFLDSSTNNFTITRNGNTTQGTFSPFSQTGWSNYFNGSTDYFTIAQNAAFNLGTGAFTIEAWVYLTAYPSTQASTVISLGNGAVGGGSPTYSGWAITISPAGSLVFYRYDGTETAYTSTIAVPLNQWVHVVVVRNGSSSLSIFVNGQRGVNVTSSISYNNVNSDPVNIGRFYSGGPAVYSYLPGYISNERVVVGTAVYDPTQTTLTVPTTPLTAISGTSLLTCQANRFRDASSNAFALTVAGTPSVQAFSPFNPTSAWSASSNGGSGYFDGSGDYLTAASNAAFDMGSGDFTEEFWVYPTTSSLTASIIDKRTSAGNYSQCPQIQINANQPIAYVTYTGSSWAITINGSSNVKPYSWNHVALTRSGNNYTLWLNGVSVGTGSAAGTVYSGSSALCIAAASTAGEVPLTGYLADVRMVKGTAVYTAAFTPPTAPLTAISGTSLLLSATNAGIYDNAAVGDYETVGNAQVSTSVYKYGTGSMAFDGAGDYLVTNAANTQPFTFGTGDFTVEFWLYLTSLPAGGAYYTVMDFRPSSVNGFYPTIYIDGTSATIRYLTNSADRITGSALSTSVWYHISLCRVASQTKLFVNGTQVGSTYADTNSYVNGAGRPTLGASGFLLADGALNGYIDDLRITKGVGRYQYNFTPPTAAFPNIGGTVTLTADPYYNYTTLLLPGNGTNGAQNNTFLDSSSNAFTITRNGNTTQGNFSPFSQTGWGAYFDGSGDYVTFGNNANTNPSSSDFTIEAWVYPTAYNTYSTVFMNDTTSAIYFGKLASGFGIRQTAVGDVVYSATAPALNQWTHVAASRSGTSWYLFYNGTIVATATSSITFSQGTASVGGEASNAAESWTGYLSNVRLVKGSAVYTANFTPSTTPLTAITNTQLLTLQNNRFLDNSSNAYAPTIGGNTAIQAFSPFAPTAAWSASTNGGSGYFDGSGDYLVLPSSSNLAFGTGDFSVEGWIYLTSLGSNANIYSNATANDTEFAFTYLTTGVIRFSGWNTVFVASGSGAVTTNQWLHVVACRSGTTGSIFVNGSRVATATVTNNFSGTTAFGVGASGAGASPITGYIGSFRVLKGSSAYDATQTTLTIPTAPLTAITNTQFLMSATNGGIVDATAKNDLETVGNAQISTTQSKFGGSSMYFDGTGDAAFARYSPNLNLGGGDFTIEGWIYFSTLPSNNWYAISSYGNSTSTQRWIFYYDTRTSQSSPGLRFSVINASNALIVDVVGAGTTGWATGTWYHVAITRYGNTWKLFQNGVQNGATVTDTDAIPDVTANGLYVGSEPDASTAVFNGYIDDLRITKGIARYTSNFTPPTSAFLLQ